MIIEKITINEFVREMKKNLSRFQEYWLAENKNYQEDFPLDMLPGDWEEQFNSFFS